MFCCFCAEYTAVNNNELNIEIYLSDDCLWYLSIMQLAVVTVLRGLGASHSATYLDFFCVFFVFLWLGVMFFCHYLAGLMGATVAASFGGFVFAARAFLVRTFLHHGSAFGCRLAQCVEIAARRAHQKYG